MRTPLPSLVALVVSVVGCERTIVNPNCARGGHPSVVATILDQDGNPAAPASRLIVDDGVHVDTAVYEGEIPPGLQIALEEQRGPLVDLVIERPWYTQFTQDRVQVPTDGCGIIEPARVEARLELLFDAPFVRTVWIVPRERHTGRPFQLTAFVDAAFGLTLDVTWSSTDTTVATVDPGGLVTPQCVEGDGEPFFAQAFIRAAAKADRAVRDSMRITTGFSASCDG